MDEKTIRNFGVSILIIIMVIIVISFILWTFKENFINLMFNDGLRHTQNMSYDLRGDPVIIPHQEFVWNNPNRYPIYNPGI